MTSASSARCRRLATAVTLAACVTAAVSCSGDDGDTTAPSTTFVVPDVTQIAPAREDDGVLKIGVLLPRTGPGAALGEPLIETIDRLVDRINDAGGALGRDVRLVVRDEGIDPTTADLALSDLLVDEEVDVIVGPGSSRIALDVVPTIVDAGVLTCSPLTTSMLLTGLPDQGLFVRTIASDELQARAIARSIDGTGLRTVSLVFPDDLYGRTFGAAVRSAIDDRGLSVVGEHSYGAVSEDFAEVAGDIVADETSVIAMIGNADNGSRLFGAIEQAAGTRRPLVVANDTIRDTDVRALVGLEAPVLSRLTGVSLEPFSGADEVRDLLGLDDDRATPAFATAAIDCVNLVVLAAEQADSDAPLEMAALLERTTNGGTSCGAVDECRPLLDQGLDIDYDGPSGLLALDRNGDVRQAEFIDYVFDADGRDTTTERFLIVGS